MRRRLVLTAAALAAVLLPAPAARAQTPVTTLAAAGDIACAPGEPIRREDCHHARVAQLIQQANPTGVAAVGDLQYYNGSAAEFAGSYNLSWGAFKAITRAVPGNHEYQTPGAVGFWSYWGNSAGEPGKGFYAYDLGTWRILALNSNCNFVPCRAGSEQERFARAELAAAASAGRCTLAFFHYPRVSTGAIVPELADLWKVFDRYRNDVAIVGHVHRYERYAPQSWDLRRDDLRGTRQFMVGTGGKDLRRPANPVRANLERLEARSFGFLLLTLRPGSYEWRFVSENTTFTDTGSGRCHDKLAPAVGSFRARPQAFRALRFGRSGIVPSGGTQVQLRLNEAGTVRFTVERRVLGRVSGRTCIAETRANRRRRACFRYVTLPGFFTLNAARGTNRFRFGGRVGGRRLVPTWYRLVAVASDVTGNVAAPKRAAFRISG
jgi:acid phosphatase type 7